VRWKLAIRHREQAVRTCPCRLPLLILGVLSLE
jgi:hypothetical protein